MGDYVRDKEASELVTKIKVTQKEYDRLKDDLSIAQIQLQEANDTLNGGITPRNMANFRNTYVINASDSLDDTYPMYVYFRVLDETVSIVSVKVSYWIHNYRAYSKATENASEVSSGATGSASGGGSTTESGGGSTSGVAGGTSTWVVPDGFEVAHDGNYLISQGAIDNPVGVLVQTADPAVSHTHSTPNHTHATPAHTHPNHTHTIPAHNHDITYGIYEEDTTPTIKFSVSQDGGIAYGKEYARVPIDRELIDITSDITRTGSKILKFESSTRARLTVQVEVKVDISVR